MRELEKISEEIRKAFEENTKNITDEDGCHHFVVDCCTATYLVNKIIRKHTKDNTICGDCSRRKWYQEGYKDGKNGNNGWIPVEERLPTREECEKSNNKFFVQTENGENFCCEYDTLANGYDDPLWSCNVPIIAWHPLPEKYCKRKGESINEE